MKYEKKKKARCGHKIRKSRYYGRPEDSRPQYELPAKSQRPVKSPPLEHGETCSHVDMQLDGKVPLNSAAFEWRR